MSPSMPSCTQFPLYPSTQTRQALSTSQRRSLDKTIEATVLDILALPLQNQCSPATLAFVASFARDAAVQTLRSLSYDQRYVIEDQAIRERMLFLLENLASSSLGLDLQTLFDLSIVYCRTRPKRMRTIVSTSLKMNPSLLVTFESEALPDLTSLLASPETATLDRLRKVSHCILSILRVFSIEFVRLLCYHVPFVCALASVYDAGLASAAQAHGGTHLLVREVLSPEREVQVWERIYLETKVALMDAFHILLGTALKEASTSVAESEQVFKLIFALLEVPSLSSSSPSSASSPQTSVPFINQTLLEDYEHAYTLSDALRVSLGRATDQDARIDLLCSMLGSSSQSHAAGGRNDPGGLKFLLLSSNNRGERPRVPTPGKGKAKASAPPLKPLDHDLTQKITQVREILPDYPPEYIRALLVHPGYSFHGDAEKVIEALLEGTAPPQDEIQVPTGEGEDEFAYTRDRNNVWDSEPMELSQVQLGKRRGDQAIALHDLALNEQMKADILRRVEAMSDEDEEFEFSGSGGSMTKSKPITLAYEDEVDLDAAVKVIGDGEGSSSSDEGNDSDEGGAGTPSPETILELAYMQDPQLFARDAVTRRGQARADLKSRTGWTDEQIEGWKIMLERNPHKDRILQKHEFSGNRALPAHDNALPSRAGPQRDGPGGHNRGRGRGAGRGVRGASRGTGDTRTGESARGRGSKEKNKASRGNHNRKRGHDKKMARAGGMPGPSS